MMSEQVSILCVRAKWLQPCLILCDPMDCSLLVSSVHGILQARTLECPPETLAFLHIPACTCPPTLLRRLPAEHPT